MRNFFISAIFIILFLSTGASFAKSRDVWMTSSSDGSSQHGILFYSDSVKPRATLLFIHGMQSHAEWMRASGVGNALAESGIEVFAYDRRGSGRSTTTRGHAENASILLTDMQDAVNAFRAELRKDDRIGNPDRIEMHLMANCFGARIAVPYLVSAATQRYYPFSTVTLIAPSTHMTKMAEYSFAEKMHVLVRPSLEYVATPLRNEWFASGAGLKWIQNDSLGLHQVTADFLRAASSLTKVMNREIYRMKFPLLIFTANRDVMVDSNAVKQELYNPYQGPKRLVQVDSAHSLEFSPTGKPVLVRELRDWILGSGRAVWNRKR